MRSSNPPPDVIPLSSGFPQTRVLSSSFPPPPPAPVLPFPQVPSWVLQGIVRFQACVRGALLRKQLLEQLHQGSGAFARFSMPRGSSPELKLSGQPSCKSLEAVVDFSPNSSSVVPATSVSGSLAPPPVPLSAACPAISAPSSSSSIAVSTLLRSASKELKQGNASQSPSPTLSSTPWLNAAASQPSAAPAGPSAIDSVTLSSPISRRGKLVSPAAGTSPFYQTTSPTFAGAGAESCALQRPLLGGNTAAALPGCTSSTTIDPVVPHAAISGHLATADERARRRAAWRTELLNAHS